MTVATAPGHPGRLTNPQMEGLSPAVADAYGRLLVAMADSELVIGHRHSEWTGFAPSAEEDVAFSSIAQDEMGHAHLYYALVTGVAEEEAVDELALGRGPKAMRHLPALHAPNGDWYFTIARHLYWDTWEEVFLTAALSSRLPLLASAAERILNEEAYHGQHAIQWLQLLSSRPAQRKRLAGGLGRVVSLAGNPASRLDGLDELVRTGGITGPPDLARAFASALRERLLADGAWDAGDVDASLGGLAARGPWPNPPGLLQLHRDLTGLRRAHPGASW